MRCCVPGCKNDSRHISKLQGVTFHVFPNEQAQRTAWLRALGKTSWEPKDRSAVCSEHFLCDDLYETRSGLRKVRSGAVPMILQDIPNCDFGDPATMKVCRICLTMDTILYPFKKYKLDHAFEQLTGLTLEDGDNLPQKLCVECAYRLVNSSKLRNKSLRANSLLCELVRKHDFLTIQNIKSISRDNNQLTSNLNHKYFEPDHFDLYLEHTDESNKPIEVIVEDVEIKNETDIFMNENEDLKEEISEAKNGQPEIRQEECQQVEEIADQDDNDDQDFALSDKEFSSDDSLPLEKRRSRKKVKHKRLKSCEDITKKVRKRQIKKDPSEPKIDRRRKPFLNEDLNETLFSITDLTFEEQVAEILKRQESANYKNAVFKCTECFKGFLDEDAYNSHMSRHTKECGEYQCDICKTHFRHSHALRKHITAHHTQRFSCNQCPYVTTHRQCDICNALRKHITAHHTQRFSCNQCPYVTTHRQTARLHERWHKGTKYQCPHCPDEFVKFTTYMGHIRIKHPSDFVCQLCGFSFVSEKGIELHKKLKHRLDNDEIPADGPLCEPCNVRFISEDAYRQHLRVSARHNTSDKEHRESNKPKKGRKSKEAKEREKMAREKNDQEEDDKRRLYPSQMRKAEGPIPCEQCGMQLEDSRAYHGHFRRMHPDKNRTNYPSMKSPCMCEVCGRMFQSYALLKDHRWVHTGERPFKCSECSKSFRMKQRLVAHRKVHSSVKASYLCNLCGKHFSTHSNRQRHMIIHTGLRPFRCEMCEKSFKHASEKRAHITYVHLKKPWPKRSRAKRRDNRQGLPPQQSAPSSDMEVAQPLWPCDPKLDHINTIMDDKPMYYNLKI